MAKLTIRDIDPAGQEVLVRVDFNVPLNEALEITDDTRIRAALPTLEYLRRKGAKLVLTSHLGRPDGEKVAKYSLRPVVARLGELLGTDVQFSDDATGEVADALRSALQPGEVLLLENTRYHAGETKNDADYARELAGKAEIFVNDAFGAAHRAHASTEGVTHFVKKSVSGFLVEKELEYLQQKLENPARPFVVIIGGAKVSDKIEVITALLDKADIFIIGGAMAYTFRKAQGYQVGNSLVENDKLDLALEILKKAEEKGVDFLLPADTRITQEFKNGAETKVTAPYSEGGEIPDGWEGIDIGDVAIEEFSKVLAEAGTIVWNGPLGVFEIESFAKGTREIGQAVANNQGVTIVGGGDSVTAVKKFGFEQAMTFISTGGGASLELLEGKVLPGVAALTEA